MKVVIIESDLKLRSIYAINLSAYLNLEILEYPSFFEAIEPIMNDDSISLVICRDKCGDETSADDMVKYFKTTAMTMPSIIMGPEHADAKSSLNTFYIDDITDVKSLLKQSAKFLSITANSMVELVLPTFYPVKTKFFRMIEESVCDVYIGVEAADNKQRHVKKFMANYKYSQEEIIRLLEDDYQELYIVSDYRLEFVNHLTDTMVKNIDANQASTQERMAVTEKTMEVFNEYFDVNEFNKNSNKLADACIRSLSKVVDGSKSLSNLLGELIANESSYAYKHCQTLIYICTLAIRKMKWGSQEQKDKLTFIAFFHDVALKTDEEVMIHSNDELENAELSPEAYERINNHANIACQKLANYHQMPMGADAIIKQHHGTRTGVGFESNPPNNLQPLAIMFIVCEEFTHEYLKSDPATFNPEEVILKLFQKYKGKDHFEKVCNALMEVEWEPKEDRKSA